MRKLKLNLDELQVESLATTVENGRWGTVNGLAKAYQTEVVECGTADTCAEGCIPDEQASFDYACHTMNMFDNHCANYTGVQDCYNTNLDTCGC
jgi:hypothetical protein